MTVIDNFTLTNLPGTIHKPDFIDHFFNLFSNLKKKEYQEDSTRSRLLFDGTKTTAKVRGTLLKAQFGHCSGYILFTANDCYETEEVFISFLDFDCKLLDSLMLDGLFSNIGFASDFRIVSADEIGFSVYQEEKRRKLRIISPPAAEFPANVAELTARSVCGHLSKHYLKLESETI